MNNYRKYEFNKNDVKFLAQMFGVVVPEATVKAKEEKTPVSIDSLLDEYNDYMTLYNMFGDLDYKVKAHDIMTQIEFMVR